MRRLLFCLSLIALLASSCRSGQRQADGASYPTLDELDTYIDARPVFDGRKRIILEGVRQMYEDAQDPVHRYDIALHAAREFFSYSFDSTRLYLERCLALAGQLGDRERSDRANILLGHLYDKSGYYTDAWTRLHDQIDTNRLSGNLKVDYLMTLYEFSKDLAGNIGAVEMPPIQAYEVYRRQLYKLLPENSRQKRKLQLDELLEQKRLEEADSLARVMLDSVSPAEHDYAIYAFALADILERQGKRDEQIEWLIRSAESDLPNAVRDYTSLATLANILLETDIDRSFRYLRASQEDAIAYNAKLRPWQISLFFMSIEDAYSTRQESIRRSMTRLSVLLASMTLLLFVLAWLLVVRSHKLTRIRKDLQDSNARLAEANQGLNSLNSQLSQANETKEKYLLDFLQRFSEGVSLYHAEENHTRNLLKQGKADQLLRELSLSTRTEKGIKEFYRLFDATFLAICPDFVERFNELLREDAQLSPKPGSLTTELRIFALIYLGVEDSREIASLLHYSPSTIYNNKVAIRNAALDDRDGFEQRVKAISK